jgi:dihydrofolate synthase/folylpolyglutamate synthase
MNALSWLDTLTNFERKIPSKYSEKAFSLDRFRALLERLGNPQRSGIPTVHILGTEGKGSTLAFLEALLLSAGRRTKAFISPHLVSVEERFRICGESVSTAALTASLEKVRLAAVDLPEPTYFEALNAAFWLWVREAPPDYVLLETGLGGRLDTTSVCEASLKILTRLERDHTALLGKTMEKISGEKLAALSPGCPVVIAPQSPFLMDRIRDYVTENRLNPIWAAECAESNIFSRSTREWRLGVRTRTIPNREFSIGLLGDHQADNFATALLAFETLGEELPPGNGVIEVRPDWRGRCQAFENPTGGTVILDGSHTAMGGQALRKVLDRVLPDADREFLFACSRDRNPWCYLRGLVRKEDRLRFVQYEHPRLWQAEELKESLVELGWNDYYNPKLEIASTETVLKEAADSTDERTTVVCGSLYWVGGVLANGSFMNTLRTGTPADGGTISKC